MLDLSSNRLTCSSLEELSDLISLKVLDLRDNSINDLTFVKFIPKTTRVLDLSGNTVCERPGYRQTILNCLPHIHFLDGCSVRIDVTSKVETPRKSTHELDNSDKPYDHDRLIVMRERQKKFYLARGF